MLHEIVAGSIFYDFCDFSSDPARIISPSPEKINENIFFRKNLLQSIKSLTKMYYTKIQH